MKEKMLGQKADADESLSAARSKMDQALEIKPDYEDALGKLSRALHEQVWLMFCVILACVTASQGDLKDGNQKFWFISQAAEKEKQLANVKAGVPNPPVKASCQA